MPAGPVMQVSLETLNNKVSIKRRNAGGLVSPLLIASDPRSQRQTRRPMSVLMSIITEANQQVMNLSNESFPG